MVGIILKRIRRFVEINCKYPYPEEIYFAEIANRCVTDAHGTGTPHLSIVELKKLWNYLKQEALRYIAKVQKELLTVIAHSEQVNYYLHAFDTDSVTLHHKLVQLNCQFSDCNDHKS